MDETYRTVMSQGEAAFSVRGSRFIGHVASAESVAAAEAFVAAVEEDYSDATHNVPAYAFVQSHSASTRATRANPVGRLASPHLQF